jgi:GNAT superfamily N-acetyltransferase
MADLDALLAFASRSWMARAPLLANWRPGDVVWELKGVLDQPQPIRLWGGASDLTAVAWFVGASELWVETLTGDEAVLADCVAWGEAVVGRGPGAKGPRLSVRSFARDGQRIAGLERLGYRRSGPEAVQFQMNLDRTVPSPTGPHGFRVRDSVGVDPAARARAHRDAWNDLAHIGLPQARSSFGETDYLALRASPVYDPSLDILVEAADGAFVANCICWSDEPSGVGVFEPVGTSPAYRGQRLAGMAIAEGLGRLQRRGMTMARVGTAHFNTSALAAYRACGFEEADRTFWWTKSL